MKEVTLTQGKVALVDDEDYNRVNQYKWHSKKNGRTYYALREYHLDGKRTSQFMHTFIKGTEEEIDHEDHNGCNNQKYNLRQVTHQQNLQNQQKSLTYKGIPPSSSFKGVSWDKHRQKWQAYIQVNHKKIQIGRFDNEFEAALAYDNAASNHYGEFAKLNLGGKNGC